MFCLEVLIPLSLVQRMNKALKLPASLQTALTPGLWGLQASPTTAKGRFSAGRTAAGLWQQKVKHCHVPRSSLGSPGDREAILTRMDERPFSEPRVIVIVKNKSSTLQSTSYFYNWFFPFFSSSAVGCRGPFIYGEPQLRGLMKRAAGGRLGCK